MNCIKLSILPILLNISSSSFSFDEVLQMTSSELKSHQSDMNFFLSYKRYFNIRRADGNYHFYSFVLATQNV